MVADSTNGTCCEALHVRAWEKKQAKKYGPVSIVVGDVHGTCCIIENGVANDEVVHIYSASKILTGYTFLKLVQAGRLTLNTKASDVLEWWGSHGGGCANLTVFHLLTQTGSLDQFKKGLGQCQAGTTELCARKAYDESCADRPVGTGFRYGETNFYVLGAIALKVTGLPNYNEVFRKYLAGPLNMSSSCEYRWPKPEQVDPGGGCFCTMKDYALFLRAALADEIVPASLRRQAEMPHTLIMGVDMKKAINVGQKSNWHYGLAQWRECEDESKRLGEKQPCPDSIGVKVSSIGIAGYYPYMWRNGEESHWGLIARTTGALPVSVSIGEEVLVRSVQAMKVRSGHTGGELQGTPATFQGLDTVAEYLWPLSKAGLLLAIPYIIVLLAMRRTRLSKSSDQPKSGPTHYGPDVQRISQGAGDVDAETTGLFAIT